MQIYGSASDEPDVPRYDKQAAQIFHRLKRKFEHLGRTEQHNQILLEVDRMDIHQKLKDQVRLLAGDG